MKYSIDFVDREEFGKKLKIMSKRYCKMSSQKTIVDLNDRQDFCS